MSQNQLEKQIRRLEAKQTNFYLEYTTVILSDSKARYVEQELFQRLRKSFSGCMRAVQLLMDNLEIKLHRHLRILLYIWVGTCNLTRKNGDFIELKSRDNLAVHELTKTYKEIYAFVYDFPTVKLSFLELPYY